MSLLEEMNQKATKLGIPLSAHLDITWRCNERCVHCYLDHDTPGEMDTHEIKDVLRQLAASGTFFLTISGGEPLFRRDCFEILEYARALRFNVKLKTNAVMIGPKEAARLKELGIVSDDMFERHPTGFGKILKKFNAHYGLPIYITEHGAASADQDFRIRDLTAHLLELHATINHGVDVRGFFYWSLLDNFEWQFGYSKKFGLLSVDFADAKLPRRMTRTGEFYRGVCTAGAPR